MPIISDQLKFLETTFPPRSFKYSAPAVEPKAPTKPTPETPTTPSKPPLVPAHPGAPAPRPACVPDPKEGEEVQTC